MNGTSWELVYLEKIHLSLEIQQDVYINLTLTVSTQSMDQFPIQFWSVLNNINHNSNS